MFEPQSRYADFNNPRKYALPPGPPVRGAIDTDQPGQAWLGLRVPVDLAPDETDRHIHPRPGERVDAFAYRVWEGHPIIGEVADQLWWVILDVNKDRVSTANPFTVLLPTIAFRVPSGDRVAALLGAG